MIILDSSTSLEVVLAGSVTANQSGIVAGYHDVIATGDVLAPQLSITNNTTAVTVVSAPASGNKRFIKSIQCVNADTANITITFRTNNGGTTRTKLTVTVKPGESIQYEDGNGWCVLGSNGELKTISTLPGRLMRKPQQLLANTAYQIPIGCTAIEIEMIGGGGSGASGAAAAQHLSMGGGGAAGGYLRAYILNPQTTTITYAIGAGGLAAATGANDGNVGGNTTFTCNSVTYTANGGNGGIHMPDTNTVPNLSPGGSGVAPTNGGINIPGAPGGPGIVPDGNTGGNQFISGFGGSTIFGGGAIGTQSSTGVTGISNTGGGGSGACCAGVNRAGGAGGSGRIVVREYQS